MEEDIGRLEAEKSEALRRAEEAQVVAEEAQKREAEAQRLAERERLLRAEAVLREAEAASAADKARREAEQARLKALESAREFLALGVPAQKVARLTGLALAEVEALRPGIS